MQFDLLVGLFLVMGVFCGEIEYGGLDLLMVEVEMMLMLKIVQVLPQIAYLLLIVLEIASLNFLLNASI